MPCHQDCEGDTMAGWETANTMRHTSSHMTANHDDFVSKYMTPSYLSTSSRESSPTMTTASSHRLSLPFMSLTQSKRLSASFPSFCTKDNVDQCISYLDQVKSKDIEQSFQNCLFICQLCMFKSFHLDSPMKPEIYQ